jgi:hypothetical protein
MKRVRPRRPSPALVISVLALVIALTGTAFAAGLGKNSVGSKQLKKNSVTTAKLKKGAVTAAKVKNGTLTGKQINLTKLGTVPTAQTANTLAPHEATHLVGNPGEPGFLSGSKNLASAPEAFNIAPASFVKDHDGFVHLDGGAAAGEEGSVPGAIFQLPAGFRPTAGTVEIYPGTEPLGGDPVFVFGSNTMVSGLDVSGLVFSEAGGAALLNGIVFAATS